MDTSFLEIPEALSSSASSGVKTSDGRDLFDISYLLELTENAGEQENAEKHIIFRLDEDTFGVPLGSVAEVCRSLPVTSLPNVPVWLSGISNLRGNLLSVIDLHAFEEDHVPASKSKIIVLNDSQRNVSIGLLVDQIIEISLLEKDGITQFAAPKNPGARHFAGWKTPYKESTALILDTKKLFSSLEAKAQSSQ